MLTNSEFKELLSLFERYKVRYLIVGGYAVMKYTEPRFTKDLDIWITTDPLNAVAVYSALKDFGSPLAGLDATDFGKTGYIYQMGRAPLRIDILMSIDGVEFEEAWKRRETVTMGGFELAFISKADLIRNKRASGRPQDMIDLEALVISS